MFCNVAADARVQSRPTSTRIYELPLLLHEQGLDEQDRRAAQHLVARAASSTGWERGRRADHRARSARSTIGIVGKYVAPRESYKSLNEALLHGGIANDCRVEIAATSTPRRSRRTGADALLGDVRRHPGRPAASARAAPRARSPRSATRAREVPFFGICLGMQLAVIEFARNVLRPRRAPTRPSSIRAHAAPGHRPDARAARRHRQGRDDAPRRVPVRAQGRARAPPRLYGSDRDQRAPPPPLRGQQRLPRARSSGTAWCSRACRPTAGLVEMIELPRPPVLRRLPVPPRVQAPPERAAPAVPSFIARRPARPPRRSPPTSAEAVGRPAP